MSDRRSAEKDEAWTCPDCGWSQRAHPRYGWASHDSRAVEVHQAHLCPNRVSPTGKSTPGEAGDPS